MTRVRINKRGRRAEFDLSGSSPANMSALNCPGLSAKSAIALALKFLIDPRTPFTSGSLRNVDVVLPPDSYINSSPPYSTGLYFEVTETITNATFCAGDVDEESRLLVERTHEAMMRGIRAAAPGRPLNAVGRVIESYARRFGYGVVRDFTGHGIGRTFHSGLIVPHYDDPNTNVIMEPGMTFTIEPMLTLGTIDYDIWPDGWTAVTKDRKRTAQFEHTILVTDDGHEILTLP